MSEAFFIFELTTRCNLDCIYCYNVWKQQDSFQQKDLTLSEVKTIVSNIKEKTSIYSIALAGGEPLLNKDFYRIADFLSSEKIKTTVTSNGLLLNEDNIQRLIECGIKHIEISMPSVENGTYKKLCRSEKLKSVRTAILNIRKYNVKLTVTSVFTKYNYKEIHDIIQLSAVFGADYFVFNRFVPGGMGLRYNNELVLDKQQLIYALEEANNASKMFGLPVIIAIPVEHCMVNTSLFPNLHFGTCVCGDFKWVVDPFGNLRSCEQNPLIIGSLLNNDFRTLSQNSSNLVFRENDRHADCKTKSCYAYCGGGCRFCR